MRASAVLQVLALVWALAIVWIVLTQVLLPLGSGASVLIDEPNLLIIYGEIGLSVASLVILGIAAIYHTGEAFD